MNHDESKIQAAIVQLLTLHRLFFFSVPNELAGGEAGAARRLATFKALGLRSGVADLVIIGGDGRVFFLEVKTKTGTLSESQKRFWNLCLANKWPYAVVRSVEEAVDVINFWKVAPYDL